MNLKKNRLGNRIADYLSEEIITGKLAPDARLGEVELAARLDVGRSSIREAWPVLERQHLVVVKTGKGARVAPLDAEWVDQLAQAWFTVFAEIVIDLDIEQVVPVIDALGRVNQDDDDEFHRAVIELAMLAAEHCPNTFLAGIFRDLMPAFRRCLRFAIQHRPAERQEIQRLLEGIVRSLKQDDQVGARALVREYAEIERAALRAIFENQ